MKLLLKTLNFTWLFLFITDAFASDPTSSQNKTSINLERKIDHFKLKLHNTLENVRMRRTRSSIDQGEELNYTVPFVSAREIETSFSVQSIAVWCVVNVNGIEVVFAGTETGHIALYHDSNLISLFSFPSHEPIYSLLSFQYGNGLWLVGLHSSRENGHFLQMYECSSVTALEDAVLYRRQPIHLSGSSFIALVNVKNRIYLILVTNKDTDSFLRLYFWTGTQLDRVLSLTLKGKCKSLTAWESDKVLFIAVSLFDKNQLQIFKLKENVYKSISILQVLEGTFHFLYHFEFAGNQYLVCERNNKLAFFWWNGVHFVEQQEISFEDSEPIIDILILVSTHDVVILVVKSSLIEYYLQGSSVPFTKSGSTEFPESWKLKGAKAWKKDTDVFYLLPIFQDQREVVVVKLEWFYFKSTSADVATTKLFNCSMELEGTVNEVEAEIAGVSSKLSSVWMKGNTSFLPSITLEGYVEAESAKIDKVYFTNEDTTSVFDLLKFHKQLLNRVNKIQDALNSTLRKSGYQEIKGYYNFMDDISVSHGNIYQLENNIQINGVHALSLHSALKTKGDQMFLKNMSSNHVNAGIVNTGMLNYKETIDYLLLKNRRQIVRGNLIFKNISISNLNKTDTLNKIKLSEIVTSSTTQNILDNKVFSLLSASNINLKGLINGVNIKELERLVVNCKYEKKIDFISDVFVTNMTIHSLNGYDIEDLFLHSVKQSENDPIKGLKNFTQPLQIEGELSVSFVNGMNLSHLMTLNSTQNIFGHIKFLNVSFKNIETDVVNGIDLSSEAITKFGYFKVNKIVRFKQPLKVDTITIKDGATIDAVDVSDLVSKIIKKSQTTFYNVFELNNVNVINDVEIEDARTALLLYNLSNNVWFKTKLQSIPFGYFNVLPVKQLYVNTWNTIPVEDIVLRNLNYTINSEKKFEDVKVDSIFIRDGRTLNGIDFNSKNLFPLITDALSHFHVNDLIIEGDLNLFAINSVNVSDLMHSQAFQYSDGLKIFKDAYINELSASMLNFSKFGNKSFLDYISKAAHPFKMIANKDFKYLKGKELDIQGFLNGRTFRELFQSIVTLNSYQNISSQTIFSGALKTKKLSIKNLLKTANLSNIVLRDQVQNNIHRKLFKGYVSVNNMEVGDAINSVNLTDLQKVVFYKGRNNTIYKPVTFLSSLKTSKIQVSSESTIDGVNFKDLIQIDKKSYIEYLNSSTIITHDVYIVGNINGCNLSDIYGGSGELETLAEKHFIVLNILGNLYIKSALNYVSEKDLTRIAVLMNSDYFNGNFYFDSMNATYLQFPISVNGMDIQFILGDAVRQQTSKGIQGKKKFRKKIFSNNTFVNSLNVTSICGLNIPLLYRKYMSKREPQIVYLKSVQQLKVRNVAIEGLLNGIKLPNDLVLIDTDEKISVPVIWNTTMILASDFFVEEAIDEVQLFQFLNNIVYLTKPDNISSSIIFLNNASMKGDTAIGFVNKISLKEVVKKFHEAFIRGSKTFKESLSFQSKLNIVGLVNNISLEGLSKNVYRSTQDEFIEDTVTFPSIKAASLDVRYINNVSLEHLWNHVHDIEEYTYTSLDRLTSIINHSEETISVIKDKQDSHVSLYGFFELYQVLNLGHSSRFLPIFEAGRFGESFGLPTIQMVVWIKRNMSCNRNFKSLIMDVEADGILTKKEEINGRVFPVSLRVLEEDVEGFRLHTDRNNRCSVEELKPDFIKTIFINGNENKNIIHSPPDSVLIEAKPLETDNNVYIIIAYEFEGDGERMYLYKYNLLKDSWSLQQKLHSWHISSFDMIYVDDSKEPEIYLAVTGDTKSGLFLYHWEFENEKFSLKTSSSKSVSSAVLWVGVDKEVFLLLTKEKTKIFNEHGSTFEYSDPVEVLMLLDDLKLNQEINIQGIHSFESFNLAGETFVLAVSRHLQTIYVIQYRGFNGFEVIQKINAPGVLEVTVFTSTNEDFLLAISSIAGHTRILKCVMRNNV